MQLRSSSHVITLLSRSWILNKTPFTLYCRDSHVTYHLHQPIEITPIVSGTSLPAILGSTEAVRLAIATTSQWSKAINLNNVGLKGTIAFNGPPDPATSAPLRPQLGVDVISLSQPICSAFAVVASRRLRLPRIQSDLPIRLGFAAASQLGLTSS